MTRFTTEIQARKCDIKSVKTLPRIKHTELNPVTLSTEELEFSLGLILLNLEHGGSENAFI